MAYQPELPPGQAVMSASSPVVIASDQSAVPISGTVTVNVISGFATAAAQTDKSQFTKITDGTDTLLVSSAGSAQVSLDAETTKVIGTVNIAASQTIAVTQATASSLNATVVQGTATNLKTQAEAYQGGSAVASGNPLQVTLANTGVNTNAIKVNVASGGIASGAIASGAIASGAVAAGAFVSGSVLSGALASGAVVDLTNLSTPITPATATATKAINLGAEYRSTLPTWTNTQQGALQVGTRGSLHVELFNTDSATAVPSGSGTATGALRVELANNGTGVVGLNAGTQIIGKVAIDQTTPGTTNLVDTELPPAAAISATMSQTASVPSVASYLIGKLPDGSSNAGLATLGTTFDADTGAGTQSIVGIMLRTPASGGSVEAGTVSSPLYISGALSTGGWTLAEDVAHVSGDLGVQALFVRNNQASVTTFAGANGDYSPAAVEGDGTLWVGGNRAHDTADAGNPEKIGGKALTARPAAVAASDRVNAWFDEFGRMVVVGDWFTRSDVFTTTSNGTTVDVTRNPVKYFGVQVVKSGAVTVWDIRLEGSLDGTNFTQILQHTNTTGDLITVWGTTPFPCLYFRSRCAGITGGTNLTVTILGTN